MKDKLGNDLTPGVTVVYCPTNHSVNPMLGTVLTVDDQVVTIATGTTNRTIVRYRTEVIVYRGEVQ